MFSLAKRSPLLNRTKVPWRDSELAEFVTRFGDTKRFPDPVAGGIDSDI